MQIPIKPIPLLYESLILPTSDEVSILHDVDHGGLAVSGEAVGDEFGGGWEHF